MSHYKKDDLYPLAPLYTVKECRDEIKEIDDEIRQLRKSPSQQSLAGNFLSFAGRLAELRQQRKDWESRLATALEYEGYKKTRSSMQGPDREIQ